MLNVHSYRVLIEALQSCSVQEVARAAYQILEMPIVVSDDKFVVIAKYPETPQDDEQWDANTIGKQIEPRFINTFTEDKHFDAYEKKGNTVLFDWGHYCHAPRLTVALESGGRRLGYFCALSTGKEVQPYHYEAAEEIAQVCSIAIKLSFTSMGSNGEVQSALLYGLLSGNAWDGGVSGSAGAVFSNFFDEIQAPYILACAKPKNLSETSIEDYLGSRILVNVSEAAFAVFENSLFVLIGSAFKHEKISPHVEKVISILKKGEFCVGLSWPFDAFGCFESSKWQAESALRAGQLVQPKESIYYYDNLMSDIAFGVLKEVIPTGAFEPLVLKTVRQHDAEHHTNYLETLETYIHFNQDKKLTAEQLCIHRNTLKYRLHRINELFKVDYNDQTLRFSLAYAKYINKLTAAQAKAKLKTKTEL